MLIYDASLASDIISTHALREEGDGGQPPDRPRLERISTHALREEGDAAPCSGPARPGHFYPRPPRGGRLAGVANWPRYKKFLPTPSARRATGDSPLIVHAWSEFLPTPSARRATICYCRVFRAL